MVTDEQVRRLRKLSNTEKNQEIAASKAGMDPTTARRYRGLERLPSELQTERGWRTREDPFGEVWDAVRRQVQESPGLEAKTLFEWLQRECPGRFSDGQIRTLQRRIKLWRGTEGPAPEVYFGQKHVPGRLWKCRGCGKRGKPKAGFPLFPRAPWKSRRRQARFPHFHNSGDEAEGKVKNQEQVFHFPTATNPLSRKAKHTVGRAGLRPRPEAALHAA